MGQMKWDGMLPALQEIQTGVFGDSRRGETPLKITMPIGRCSPDALHLQAKSGFRGSAHCAIQAALLKQGPTLLPERSRSGRCLRKSCVLDHEYDWTILRCHSHESAHTFGATHDCTSGTCGTQSSQCCPFSSDTCSAEGRYIMDPISNTGMTRFSPCTIGTVCSRMGSGRVDSSCLASRSTNQTDSGKCGNGIVETGEACDCGNGACNSRDGGCCDSLTCQWMGGDQCDSSGNERTNGDEENDGAISSWVSSHLRLVIGLAAGVGGALILFIFAMILIGCRGSKKKRKEADKLKTRAMEN